MDLNLTAMIDVVFQLLIYFIITASFTEGEGVITANFPVGSGGAPDPLKLEQPIKITVASKGEAGYRLAVDKSPTDPSTFGDLYKMLEGMQESHGGYFKDDNPVVIQPTADVRWQHVVNAFNAAIRAKFKNIAFAQHGGGEGG
jgi:biopolymer transport protein ExbD